jgi:hypothetical protein
MTKQLFIPAKRRTTRFLPRFVRLRDAPNYLGMDRNRFNRSVRPHLVAIPIGKQGIAFDRLDLDESQHRLPRARSLFASMGLGSGST